MAACTHTPIPPLTATPHPAHAMPPVAPPTPASPLCAPETRHFGKGLPSHVASLPFPHVRVLPSLLPVPSGLCPAKEELGGGSVWWKTGPCA